MWQWFLCFFGWHVKKPLGYDDIPNKGRFLITVCKHCDEVFQEKIDDGE